MTKPIAAAARMVLVEERRLRLDEPVDRLLPELADAATLRLEVRAPITLRIAPRVVPAGGSFQMRGRLLAAPRRQGKLVALEAHERGRWRPFELVDATRRGRYRARWRFSPGARGTYPIRAVAVAEASYPYAVGRSRPVRVRVR